MTRTRTPSRLQQLTWLLVRCASFALAASAALALAADGPRRSFNVASGAAERALRKFAEQAGIHLIFAPEITDGIRTKGVKGELNIGDAADRLLEGTNLKLVPDKETGVYSLARATAPQPASDDARESLKKNEIQTAQNQEPMKDTNKLFSRLAVIFATLIGSPGSAQDASAGGIIEGRVLNSINGNYLNNARVMIEGTNVEAFTNNFGEYRLTNVPAGTVTVRATYTGLMPESATVTISSGARATRDFSLTRGERATPSAQGETVMLDAFVTEASKGMSSREIALNEQRFADNFKNVVSADEFGDMAEGNVGEFLKYLPGITIDYVGVDARNISVRGLPSSATAVMADGAPMASAASSGASRIFELEQVSINNISRVEVTKSPTPDLPANAVGGAVNMISRSAFERSKPQFNYRAYLNWNTETKPFEKTNGGPSREPAIHTNPSFDFSYIKPVNENFGFTITGAHSDQYAPEYRANPQWFPGASGSALAPTDNPFMSRYGIFYGPKVTQRTSVGSTVDWRISHGNVLTLGAQWNYYDAFFNNKNANFDVNALPRNVAPADWGPTFTQGRPNAGIVNRTGASRRKSGTTAHLSLKFVHDGPVWKFDAGATYSDASNHYRDADEGYVNNFSVALRGYTMRFDGINAKTGTPDAFTVTDAAGAPVEWQRLDRYDIDNFVINQIDSRDLQTSARVNARRDFQLPWVNAPVIVKTGLDVRKMDRDIRDILRTRYNFVGPDGSNAASSTDDFAGLYDIVDTNFYQDWQTGFGEPRAEYVDPYKLYDLFVAHPEYFREDVPFRVQQMAQDSRKLTERVSAAYFRTDWRFFNNRLGVVAGVRYERTDDEGAGVLNDPSARYQKDARGELVRGANGLPIRIPNVDAAAAAELQFTDRGAHAKRNYDGFFPSVNAVFNLTENLLLRASYAQTIARPNLSQIIPGMTISDPNTTNENNLLIRVNNTALNPWTAENYDLGLEYYFGKSGGNVISIGGFKKDIKDFFASRREDTTPEILESFGLDETYLLYDIQYNFNAGDATVTGLDVSYRQGLTFLPDWARGIDVFYNVTSQRLQGSTLADFSNFIRRNDNYGVTLSRPKFTLRLKVNDRGRQRNARRTGTNMAVGAYRYQAPRRFVDIDFEYRLRRGLSLFVAGRNVTQEPSNYQEIYGEGTPEYARTRSYWKPGVSYVMGFKGSF